MERFCKDPREHAMKIINYEEKEMIPTAWKVSKYRVIFGPYFSVFGLNTRKNGPEITPNLDIFYAVTANW